MITKHALLYLGARLFAAGANLAAVAIFTRLAASDVYGGYLLIFSWAFVLYGFLGQWLGAAFFAVYEHETAAAQIGMLGRLVLGALLAAGAVILTVATAGFVPWPLAGALFLVFSSLTLFITVMEAERTRLEAGIVSIILMLRAAMLVTLGALTLLAGGGALALAVALATANIVAALPGLIRLAPHIVGSSDHAALGRFLNYGWPLVIAFGVTALGQNVDRLILAHVVGTAELGSYGATSDFLKQSFGVVSEAIVLAVVSIAKNAAIRGDDAAVRRTLEDAFRALATTVLFGAVFMVIFADELVQVVFGPDFRDTARALVPSLIIANGVLIFRAFYFGQSIYFGQSSRNEVIAAALMLSVTGALSATLIPNFGIFGAAWAATGGQIAACCVFVVARPRMPIPFASLVAITATAVAVLCAAMALDHVALLGVLPRFAGKLIILAAAGAFVIWRFNILGFRDFTATFPAATLSPSRSIKTMRILQIVHRNEAGGVKTLSEIIGVGLAARGVAVETVWLFPSPEAGSLGKFAGTWHAARRIVAGRYDAVIAYQSSASILTGLVGRLARCPCRIVHQTALPGEVKAPMRWLDCVLGTLGFYSANIANSLATAAAFARYPAPYRRAMIMIEHGVPAPRPTRSRAATSKRFGIPDDRRILLNVGRLTPQKNQGVLIGALAQVPSARLMIAGGGPLRSEYEALAAHFNVADRLHLLGNVTRDDIANLLAASDLFVFPSTWETFGLAAVEAAMADLPIVAADLPVLREVLSAEGGTSAVFVPPLDTAAWARAIARSAQTNPAKRHAIAHRYSVARMIDAYIALLGTEKPA